MCMYSIWLLLLRSLHHMSMVISTRTSVLANILSIVVLADRVQFILYIYGIDNTAYIGLLGLYFVPL